MSKFVVVVKEREMKFCWMHHMSHHNYFVKFNLALFK
jgi:hypothetical protein